MNIKNALHVILFGISFLFVGACKDAWDEHTEILGNGNKLNLLDKIAAEPSLSKFYGYLQQTKLDKKLASSNVYTVWAPDNTAIETFLSTQGATYLSDSATLSQFVSYYIADLNFPVGGANGMYRVKTLSGLNVSIDGMQFEEVGITKADQFAKNGILHILGSAIPVKKSVFEYATGLTTLTKQLSAMSRLDTVYGNPIAPDSINRSAKWKSIVNALTSSDSTVTYFVLDDVAYQKELDKITPYYISTSIAKQGTTDYITSIALLENLVVRGIYTLDKLPDTLVSIGGVKLPIKKSAIVSSYKANNGIVYVLNELPYRLKDRIGGFKIEGEQNFFNVSYRSNQGFPVLSNVKSGNTFRRYKIDSLGIPFRDIEIYNHAQAEFYIQYAQANVHSVKYDVYARAVSGTLGDSQQSIFTQRFGTPNVTDAKITDVKFTQVVNLRRYNEVFLGQYTKAEFGTLNWRLLAANSGSVNVNTLILDYVRFVPVLPN